MIAPQGMRGMRRVMAPQGNLRYLTAARTQAGGGRKCE